MGGHGVMLGIEAVRKSEIFVIPGLGRSPRTRNPGTQTSASLGMAGVHRFRAWSYGTSRNDPEVSAARQGHFSTASFCRRDPSVGLRSPARVARRTLVRGRAAPGCIPPAFSGGLVGLR